MYMLIGETAEDISRVGIIDLSTKSVQNLVGNDETVSQFHIYS